jgi:acylaminoacyl-peptidase
LTWLAPFEGVLNVWLAPADDIGAAEPLTRLTGRPIAWQDWACDGEHILFISDENGDENWRIFAVDVATAEIRTLTPISGVSARILMWSPERPGTILVGLNDRDKKWHDVWAVDLATTERRLVLENRGSSGASISTGSSILASRAGPIPSTAARASTGWSTGPPSRGCAFRMPTR